MHIPAGKLSTVITYYVIENIKNNGILNFGKA